MSRSFIAENTFLFVLTFKDKTSDDTKNEVSECLGIVSKATQEIHNIKWDVVAGVLEDAKRWIIADERESVGEILRLQRELALLYNKTRDTVVPLQKRLDHLIELFSARGEESAH